MNKLRAITIGPTIPIVVTNQVQTTPDDCIRIGSDKPIGGNVMEHASTYRINLRHLTGNSRAGRLVKTPSHCENDTVFTISNRGISVMIIGQA